MVQVGVSSHEASLETETDDKQYIRTGKGEKGKVAVVVQEDQTGDAGENSGFSVDLMGQGSPEEYTYSAD